MNGANVQEPSFFFPAAPNFRVGPSIVKALSSWAHKVLTAQVIALRPPLYR